MNISLQKPSEWEDSTSQLDENKKEQTINAEFSGSTRKQKLVYNTRKLLHEEVFNKKQTNIATATNISILNIVIDNETFKYSPYTYWKMVIIASKWQRGNFYFGSDLDNFPLVTTKIRMKI